MAEVVCSGLSRRFGDAWALTDVSCEVPSGGALLVAGPSGSGKTTLLRLIAGLLRPDGGCVRIGGATVTGPSVMIAPHRRGIAFVFQRPALWPHMTALDNVALALVGRGLRRRERRARAADALDGLEMSGRQAAYPASLSGGETQRVGLARALAAEPRVLLLDEPFTALDARLRNDLIARLLALKSRRGVTILWVAHGCDGAAALADRLLLLRDGTVEESGEVRAVLERPTSAFAAAFLRDAGLCSAGPGSRRDAAQAISRNE